MSKVSKDYEKNALVAKIIEYVLTMSNCIGYNILEIYESLKNNFEVVLKNKKI